MSLTLMNIVIMFILVIIGILILKIIIEYGGVILKILIHLLGGWISLWIVNLLPGINIPVNLLTMAISGFGGILGTLLLIIINIL